MGNTKESKNTKSVSIEEEVNVKKSTKTSKPASKESAGSGFFSFLKILKDERFIKIIGVLLVFVSFYLLIAFVSYFINWFGWNSDDLFSEISFSRVLFDQSIEVNNYTGRLGAALSHLFIKQWFGISSFVLLYFLLLIGIKLAFDIQLQSFRKVFKFGLFTLIWLSASLAFFVEGPKASVFGGIIGYELIHYLTGLVGKPGSFILISFALLAFVMFTFDVLSWFTVFNRTDQTTKESVDLKNYKVDGLGIDELAALENQGVITEESEDEEDDTEYNFVLTIDDKVKKTPEKEPCSLNLEISNDLNPLKEEAFVDDFENEDELELGIEAGEEETEFDENMPAHSHGIDTIYDPTEDLKSYMFPSLDLLKEHSENNEITINKQELEDNKNRIVSTLLNYSIQIDKISATVGPTITLYEIVPAPGIRISKIKNLEDDIAMSLAALGIRIIAPIPGRGTIGIEVPNKNPEIVSMRTILASEKFQTAKFDLPVAIGKTISNETFVFDLAKMPHLLVAGATGQGKSVGLNAIITSLLYKKHPAQLKFVMVDPKKVEFSLFSKIERHYLAKLPDRAEPIITDVKDVVTTLNSLCIEMDDRYDLLKIARAKNIKEYNAKFVQRQLNPENGHRYMPYIVLIVDEFADLIMTAGREVEGPIARLAQLARAIGIHLVIATQRPSVNVITGLIKANFPARIAFRVTSKIDSRTILDSGGADQLIGRGDMLFSKGDGLVRLQCAFIDTPEVEDIVDYIGQQRGYPSAFNLPEFVGDEDGGKADVDIGERDPFFEEAARIIVQHQQGSTSLIQRKMKLGYNRAGRIIDQLEAAGIVGPFGGSKAREVLMKDMISLEQYLSSTR
jgi:S-DNA-T family DNA segregation ATPase FtsK/SpoIIIE